MKKITKTTIASVAAIVLSIGCLTQATAATITLSSKGIIESPGADGLSGTADDVVFDSRDLVAIKNNIETAETNITNGKNSIRDTINSNVKDADKLPAATTPDFSDIVAKLPKIREKGREDVTSNPASYDADITAGNIRNGVNIFGVTGTYETQHSGTYNFPANDTGGTKDLGITHTTRYVNAQNVYNKGKADGVTHHTGTYTFPANDTGGTKDLGDIHSYRYVNAGNVYNKGKADVYALVANKTGQTVSNDSQVSSAIDASNISYTREYLQSLGGIEIINQTGFNDHGNGNCDTCAGARNQFTVPIGIARAYDIYLAPVTSGWNGVNVTVSAGNKGDWGYSSQRPKLTFNNGSQYNTFNSIPQYQYSKLNVDFDNTINRNQIGDYGYIMIYIQADTSSNHSMMDMSIQLVPKS